MNVDITIDDPIIRIDSTAIVIDSDWVPTEHMRVRASSNNGRR